MWELPALPAVATNSYFYPFPGSSSSKAWERAWLCPAHKSWCPACECWKKLLLTLIGNPFLLLGSVLELLCSQCIPLEGCPLRVAMVTILVLHARKSWGTCWSHHQNLSLWKISRWHLSEIPTSWLIWENEEHVAMLISFNLDCSCWCLGVGVKQLCVDPRASLTWWVLSFSQRGKSFGDLDFSKCKSEEQHDFAFILRGVGISTSVLERSIHHF